MKDATNNDPMLPSSSSSASPPFSSTMPSSLVHCTMTIYEACAHYMDMVWEEPLWEARDDAAYKHLLLKEHLQTEERLGVGRAVAPFTDLAEQEALLESYHSIC
ncbi:Peroxisomal biogenesis factor 3 [Hordeum vulgare]|nr:Peroxisomal biogenesis factor 3 [Hordeum vulgare]